ncbi:hypothetical protein EUX98_g3204 [Antrodiella citrinella]|uniref:G domain-containing protein n=1 Tax=Antrodiella citrinella TaxID=2447956 RepID=A0A4S4MZ82_9APHY|nr:hypothetical protein EUX98_g3204 [Antrodiella citrinella]
MRLIDTPGFDDTTQSDAQILKMIAEYLANTYRLGKKLSGIIYMHRISDPKMSGVSKRNFGMFRSLCGEKTLRNVVIVTNMWGLVEQHVGDAREHELATDDTLFKPVLDKGAVMVRHDGTVESAHRVLQSFVANHPEALAIQTEVVDDQRGLDGTTAGLALQEEMTRQMEETKRRQEEQVKKVQEATAAALREQEERQAAEIGRAKLEMEEHMRRAQEEQERETARQAAERRQEEERRRELEAAMAAEQEAQRKIEEEQRRVQAEMEQRAREAEAEIVRMREEVQRMENERHNGGCNIF